MSRNPCEGDDVVSEPRGYIPYRVSGLPAGHFGETYAIVTGTVRENGIHTSEFFAISKRHKPELYRDVLEFSPGDVPEELLNIDEDYLFSEARQQAQNYFDDALYQFASAHGDQVFDRYRAELMELRHMPLLSLWMRGELHEEIRTIARETQSPRLRFVLSLVTQSSVIRRG